MCGLLGFGLLEQAKGRPERASGLVKILTTRWPIGPGWVSAVAHEVLQRLWICERLGVLDRSAVHRLAYGDFRDLSATRLRDVGNRNDSLEARHDVCSPRAGSDRHIRKEVLACEVMSFRGEHRAAGENQSGCRKVVARAQIHGTFASALEVCAGKPNQSHPLFVNRIVQRGWCWMRWRAIVKNDGSAGPQSGDQPVLHHPTERGRKERDTSRSRRKQNEQGVRERQYRGLEGALADHSHGMLYCNTPSLILRKPPSLTLSEFPSSPFD